MSGASDLRASDDDRERTAEVVRQAASEGRLDLSEVEERLDRVFKAKTYGELALVTEDLPNAVVTARNDPPEGAMAIRVSSNLAAIFGEEKVKGSWLVPPAMQVKAVFGSVTLDFTEATVPHEVVIDALVVLGEIKLILPDDVAVVLEHGQTILGSRTNKTRTEHRPGTPVIRVRGQIILGELSARPKRRWFGR